MKFLRLIITTLVLCVFNSHSVSSQERTVEDDIFYFDSVSEVLQDCFQGWIFDRDSRKWYGNPNVILRSDLPQNCRKAKKGGFVYSQHTNIYNLQTASIVYDILGRGEKQRYYVLFWQKWKGYYDYPNIQEDWRWYRTYDYYIFSEDETAWENRKILTDLKIEEVKNKKDVDNVMSIKFKPNYKQSSTKYIIIIAQQNDKNTKEAFNDPCYIVGDNDSITAEVDIADIVHSSNKYVVNIISHELRFDKKIHFYQSLDFKDKSGGLSDAEIALAVVFPIIGAALIGVGIFFYCKKRGHSSSEQIEKLNG